VLLGDHGLTRDEKTKVKCYVWLFVAAAIFWMIYDQAATVLSFFAQNQTDLNVLGFHMPSSWTQSFNPIMIIVLAPVFAALWVGPLARLSIPAKFAIALVLVGGSYFVMAVASGLAANGTKVTVLWLVLVYLIQTCGELCLSPVGLSATVKLAPQRFLGQMMGLWWLAVAVGDSVGGQMAKLQGTTWSEPVYFLVLGSMAVIAGLAMVAFVRRLRELMADQPSGVPTAV
jgi:POT family proton-dependent oligopeptide transporter